MSSAEAPKFQSLTAIWNLRDDRSLSARQARVLFALASHANDKGGCFPSMATIAAVAHVGEQAARAAVRELERRNGPIRVQVTRDRKTANGDAAPHAYTLSPGVGWTEQITVGDERVTRTWDGSRWVYREPTRWAELEPTVGAESPQGYLPNHPTVGGSGTQGGAPITPGWAELEPTVGAETGGGGVIQNHEEENKRTVEEDNEEETAREGSPQDNEVTAPASETELRTPGSPLSSSERQVLALSQASPEDVAVLEAWRARFKKEGVFFTADRAVTVAERRAEDMTQQHALDAIEGAAADGWFITQGAKLELIFGKRSRFEAYRDAGRAIREGRPTRPQLGRIGIQDDLSFEELAQHSARVRKAVG